MRIIETSLLLYVVTWAVSPPIQYGNIFRIILIACFLMLMLIKVSQVGCISKKQTSILGFIFFLIITTAAIDGLSAANHRLQLTICLLFFMLYYFYENDVKILSLIFWYTITLCIIWNITTIDAYATTRNISRMFAKSFEGAEAYACQGIGGYGYVYSMVFMLPIAVTVMSNKMKNYIFIKKVVLATFICTSSLLIFKAGYFIAIIITFIGILGVIVSKMKSKQTIVFIYIFFILSFLLLLINFDIIFTSLAKLSEGTMYHTKIQDIISSMGSEEAQGTVDGRYERYSRSLLMFFQSPLWGHLTRADVGKHSQILDFFAQYGIFIGIWFCSIFIKFRKHLIRKYYNNGNNCINTVIACFFIFSFLNNIAYSNGVIVAMCLPGALCILNADKDKTYYE